MDTPYYMMGPNAGFPAGFPVPTQSPSNQMAFYPNSMPQYPQSKTPHQPGQQQQQQHSFGAMPMQPGGPGGAMMPSGFPQQSSAPMDAFSAPFAQPTVPASMPQFSQPATAPNQPSTVQQTFNQNMASLNANLLANQPKPSQMNPQMNHPMNSQMNTQMNSPQPTHPGTPVQAQAHAQPQVQAQIQAQAAAREKARVTVLLEINSTLLQEVVNLQAAGKAGSAPNADHSADHGSAAPKPAPQKPSPEYIECMRRLQANLSYLATIAERAKKPGGAAPQAPAILTPPSNVPAVNDLYNKLNELFPRPSQSGTPQKLSPGTMQGNGRPSPSPVTESVV